MEEKFTPSEAAKLLGIDCKTVKRAIERRWLVGKKENGNYLISEDAINAYNQRTKARAYLDSRIRELYVLRRHGTDMSVCTELTNCPRSVVVLALQRYEEERESAFKVLNITNAGPLLLGKEIAGRLRVGDPHIIEDLIDKNALQAITHTNGRKRYIIYDDSFRAYLGDNINSPFHTSAEAAEMNNMSVEKIDRLAKENGVGRKILPTTNSMYLFTLSDITNFSNLTRKG